jgi:hypothetical protein
MRQSRQIPRCAGLWGRCDMAVRRAGAALACGVDANDRIGGCPPKDRRGREGRVHRVFYVISSIGRPRFTEAAVPLTKIVVAQSLSTKKRKGNELVALNSLLCEREFLQR